MAKSVVKAKVKVKGLSVRLTPTAEEIETKRNASAINGTKLHYTDKGALKFADIVDTVAKLAIIGGKVNPELAKAQGKELRANAQARREWCLKNSKQVRLVSRKEIQVKPVEKLAKGSTKVLRPDNALRMRLSTLAKGKNIGYIRYLSNAQLKANPRHPKAEMVILYRKG